MEKTCTSCGITKPIEQFHKKKTAVLGRQEKCKPCRNKEAKLYRSMNSERLVGEARGRRVSNGVKINSDRRARYIENRPKILAEGKRWRDKNKDWLSRYNREYSRNNRDKINASMRAWYKKNSGRINEEKREEHFEKYKKCPAYTCKVACRRIVRRCVVDINNSGTAETKRAGIDVDKFKQRIETNFLPGMSWDNYGEWHIDHSIPISRFISRGCYKLPVINSLCNLRPMWARDNLSKGKQSVLDSEYRDKINANTA